MAGEVRQYGSVASCRLLVANQIAHQDTIDIGTDVYEFLVSGSGLDVAADVNIGVLVGVDAEATRANLIAAINATDADNAHATLLQTDSTTPAVANGTESLVADEIGTTVRIRNADAAGGNPLPGEQSIVLAEAITDAADIWDCGEVNMNTLAGRGAGTQSTGYTKLAVTAAMITAGTVRVDFSFTATNFLASVESSAGVLKADGSGADTVAIANGGLLVTLNNGAGDIDATDVLKIIAWA